MVRKLISLTLALSLALGLGTTALAADVADLFPPINEYNGYADVSDSAWYADAAQVCDETGLMTGTSATTFSPNTTMNITQAASLAVRVYDVLHGGDGVIESPEGTPWYTGSIALTRELAQAAGRVDLLSRLNHLSDMATRSEFFGFMSLAVGEELLTPINTITTLPDTDDPYILALYNAGIMSGMDAYGSFSGSLTLRRSEAATMVARIIRPELRQTFTPTPLPLVCQAARVLPTLLRLRPSQTVSLWVNNLNLHLVLGYVGYYVLGYYLKTYTLSRAAEYLIYILGILGAVVTVGGTGIGPRDVTPEATAAVCPRVVPGLGEAMRAAAVSVSPRLLLSRGVAAIRGKTMILNVSGNREAAEAMLKPVLEPVAIALSMLNK